MKNVILEYTGAAVGLMGSVGFFAILDQFFFGENGLFAKLIVFVVQGGG